MMDEKRLIVLCATLIAVASLWVLNVDAETIVTATIAGLFGVAVGKGM